MSKISTITVTQEEYDDLIDSAKLLAALMGAGVDNWEGYEEAMENYRSEQD